VPSRNRFNAGVGWTSRRFVGSAGLNYADKAFWTDVLSAPFFGATDSYAMLNAAFGVKWLDGKLTTTLKGTNLANEAIQQHVRDILKMQPLRGPDAVCASGLLEFAPLGPPLAGIPWASHVEAWSSSRHRRSAGPLPQSS
jgi:hypothetical protein